MSSRNGDKARFGRQRKQKLARRLELRTLKSAKPAETMAEAGGEHAEHAGQEHSGEKHGVLASAARLVGAALGTVAKETHLAGAPSQTQE